MKLNDWLIDWLIGRLIGWLVDWLIAVQVMSKIDEAVKGLENIDTAILLLKQTGAHHRKFKGFRPEYFRVSGWLNWIQTSAALLIGGRPPMIEWRHPNECNERRHPNECHEWRHPNECILNDDIPHQ